MAINFSWASDKKLMSLMEQMLMDSKRRVASTEDVGTSMEVKRDDIRLAAKNINEVEKMLITYSRDPTMSFGSAAWLAFDRSAKNVL